jgi:murein L,D-transpeptidase YafK
MRTLPFNALARATVAVLAILTADAARSSAGQHAGANETAAGSTRIPAVRANEPKDAAPEAWGSTQIVVFKSRRILALYRGGDFEKEFPVVLGLQPEGRKRHANDARTPEGSYRVIGRSRHDRWQWFLAIDYPNQADRRAYDDAVRAGRIPDEDGAPFTIGSEVGIHGNDRAAQQDKGSDWTKGCVAMKAADVAELAARTPVGTPVWIVE